jgi:Tfp pilus assembly protein PilO
MDILKEKRQLVIFAVALAVVLGFVFFRFIPLKKELISIRQDIAAQKLVIEQARAQQIKLVAAKEKFATLQKASMIFDMKVPNDRNLGDFLHQMAKLMNKHRLVDQMIVPADEIQAGQFNCIPVNMQCKGKLAEVFGFFRSLQQSDRLVRIEQVDLNNDEDFTGDITMTTKAVIYYRSAQNRS